MGEWVRVASAGELEPGTLTAVEAAGRNICLAVTSDGEAYALQDNCSHKDFPLSAGELDDHRLTCEWHGAKFDVQSGRALSLPAIKPVKVYDLRIEGDDVLVKVE